MRKIFFLLGFLFAFGILFLAGSTMAGPKQCPPGQRDNCDYWRKKNHPNQYGCFPEKSNLGEGWIFVSDDCPDKKEKQPKPTNTSKPEIKPTNTVLPKNPTNTPEKISDPKDGNKVLSTPEVLYVDSVEKLLECPEDCVCELMEQVVTAMAIENRLRLTDIGIQLTRNAIMAGE